MNKYVQSETNQHVMKLIQMGANIKVVSSQMVYVSFDITEEIKVSYVYNINKKNKYFLERIKPYPISVKEFETADDICNIIKIDIEQFRNAAKSHNIYDFIKINYELHNNILSFEDLFLYYNIDSKTLNEIKTNIDNIHRAITSAKTSSERVYFGKEPDYLQD
ncbi:MAG: hypothetical protein PHC62_06300 [Candidatus Izemoplasmatales bacterium]|nr:hypothetical protein [Candidatus Izemoplasmatales bacterium]